MSVLGARRLHRDHSTHTDKKGIGEDFFRYRLIPQVMAFVSYHISWLLYVIRPEWSHLMNAHFEDHAEHEYLAYVQIGYDERVHREESLARIEAARFR